jgi:hypothetical protein
LLKFTKSFESIFDTKKIAMVKLPEIQISNILKIGSVPEKNTQKHVLTTSVITKNKYIQRKKQKIQHLKLLVPFTVPQHPMLKGKDSCP